MKLIFKFLIVAIAISTVQAFAQGFYCSTTPASTSYTLSENSEGNFELLIRHNLGVEHAPLLNGITTGYTLGIVEDRFEYAKKMGQSFQVKFPKDKCRFEENLASCSWSKPSQIGDLKVDGFSVIAYKSRSVSPLGEFTEIRVRFDYRVERWSHEMTMEFSEFDCRGDVFQ
jgi:hypothetical protein